jgi:hypothetical protein
MMMDRVLTQCPTLLGHGQIFRADIFPLSWVILYYREANGELRGYITIIVTPFYERVSTLNK